MILKNITPIHFGPFASNTPLLIEPDVTVLTGPNDAGKSLALRAIQVLCNGAAATELDRHRVRLRTSGVVWQEDPEFACEAEFEIYEPSMDFHIGKPLQAGDLLQVRKKLGVNSANPDSMYLKRGNQRSSSPTRIKKWPNIIWLPLNSEVGDALNLRVYPKSRKSVNLLLCLSLA